MRVVRRFLRIVAILGTLVVAIVALALIASQTPWFRDWLRQVIVRETKQYINGELAIGGLSGNLFYGVGLSDVAVVDLSGERIVAIKSVQIDYNVFDLVSSGIVLDRLVLTAPDIRLRRDADGWNVGKLVKAQRQEADREGPGRPVSLPSITIVDGRISVDDRVDSDAAAYRIPSRIESLQVQSSFAYEPVRFSVGIDRLTFRGSEPDLALNQLTGKVAVRDDNLYLEDMVVKTGETGLTIGGVIENYLATPVIKLTTTGTVSLPEISRVVPALEGYDLRPTLTVNANGAADNLALDLDVRSEAGYVRGRIVTDVQTPDLGVKGQVHLERFNLAPLLKDPAQKSDLNGDATIDLVFASEPAASSFADRIAGTFSFSGPRVVGFGYAAAQVRAAGRVDGPRIVLSNARASAYGGSASTTGVITLAGERRPLSYDLKGAAANIDLRRLPAALRVPKMATNLSVADYHVRGVGGSISGSATLGESTVEGATIAGGTTGEFRVDPTTIAYKARGSASNVDLQRFGKVLEIAALAEPLYQSRLNSTFDVDATGTALEEMALRATGTVSDSAIVGATVPSLDYDVTIADAALTAVTKGRIERLNPAVFADSEALQGNVTAQLDTTIRIAALDQPITAEGIEAGGRVLLEPSLLGGVQIARAVVDGRYTAIGADLAQLEVEGPDVSLTASGRVALDRASESNLTYRIDAADLTEVGRLAGQGEIDGSAIIEGTVTGNAAALVAQGTLNGANLAFAEQRALDLNSTFKAVIPELDVARISVEATTDATFLNVGGLELNELQATTIYAEQRLAFETTLQEQERRLSAKGDVTFHPDHQEVHLTDLALQTQGIEWRTAPGAGAAVQYGQNQLTLQDVRLVNGDQSIDVSGSLGFKGAAAGKLVVNATNLDLSQVERLMLQDRGIAGRLTANAVVSGTTDQPVVEGKIEIRNGGFQGYKYDALNVAANYAGTQVKLDAELQQSAGVQITVNGVVPTSLFATSDAGHVEATAGDEVNLRIATKELNLGVVQGFTTQVTNVLGTLEADVTITGSGRDPHLGGFVEVRNGSFAVPAGGVSFSGLDTRIDLEPDVVRIRRFEILDENGEQMAIEGQLAVHARQVGAVDVTIESNNFELVDNELGDIGVDSRLKLTGQLSRPRVEGSVSIQAGRLEVDRILQLFYDPYSVDAMPEVVSAEREVAGSGSAEEATRLALARASAGQGTAPVVEAEALEPTGFSALALDVNLRIPENLVLRGKKLRPGGPTSATVGDINLTVGGDLDIRKAPGGPVTLFGEVTTVRGTYQFQGRQFDLVRGGTLRFTGDSQINPNIDITASRQIPDTGVEARVRITGTASAPEISLSSTPPLEEADVLALIVFNRQVNELGTGERASLAATAGGIATGFLASPLGDSIGRALDLDLFEITTQAEGDSIGAGVTIGQQVGDRAFFKIRQQFGDRSLSEFLLEYRLTDYLRAVASAAPETSGSANRISQRRIERAGIDLIFFFSY